jgi:KDO2-lipid IV(A) lauroyltransferase
MHRHIEFRGLEQVEQCFDEGQPCAAILGHYCNWELLSSVAIGMKRWGVADPCGKKQPEPQSSRAVMGLVYHPLYSHAADQLFLDLRQSLGGTCIPKQDILRWLVTLKRDNRMSLFGYIADQAPKWENIHLWLPFLNHETPVFTGAERIIRKMQNAVFYVDMERPRRGRYVCTFRLISREPHLMPEHEVTRRFFQMLEESMRRDPRFYLWSHNRWKRTREEFIRRFPQLASRHL